MALLALTQQHSQFDVNRQLGKLYRNLRSEYRECIRRSEVTTLTELIKRVNEHKRLHAPTIRQRISPSRRPSPNQRKNNVAEVTERPVAGVAASATTIVIIVAEQDGRSVPTAVSKNRPLEGAVATRRQETPQGLSEKAHPGHGRLH